MTYPHIIAIKMSRRLSVICHGCALVLAAGGLRPLGAQSAADSLQTATLEKVKR